MDKPFAFGTVVGDEHFVGRTKEILQLENNFKYGVNTILMSPRRIGKTSLVKKVAAGVKSEKLLIVNMDIFACRSEYDFLNMFASSILQQTYSSLSLGLSPKTHKPEEVLNLPELIAEKKGCHIIVCIDEFQQIGDFPDSITVQKRMRSVWQHQQNVSYCLYGSKKNMMLSLFQKSSKPFYKFGTIMDLGVIPVKDWVPYLCSRFSVFGKTLPEEVAGEICSMVQSYSSYVQQLAYYAFLCTKETTTSDNVKDGFQSLLDENTSFFTDRTENLTTYQMNFLRAVLDGIHKDFGKAQIRDEYNLGSTSNITRIKESLIKKELIDINSEGIFISDPVLAEWMRQRMVWA